MQIVRQSRNLFMTSIQIRNSSDKIANAQNVFVNRNPRNLERMGIGYKPDGYYVDKPGKCYWHKLDLTITGKYVTATVSHYDRGEVLRASTSEWCIKKQLYRPKDTCAFINLGRILGQRCLQSGLTEMNCYIEPTSAEGKIALFLKALEESGVRLQEREQFKKPCPWDRERPEKPWEITE